MSKKVKITITSVICLIIIGIGIATTFNNATADRKSKEFINSIKYIQDGKYIKAYNNIKNGDKKEVEIIQIIILNIFSKEFDKSADIVKKIGEEADNITDYLTYTYIYSKDDKYQQNIDKLYDDEYQKLYDVKDKISQDIIPNDALTYYNLYFEYLDLANGMFKNYEYNLINNKDNLINRIQNVSSKLSELQKEYETITGKYPLDSVPEEYRVLLELSK